MAKRPSARPSGRILACGLVLTLISLTTVALPARADTLPGAPGCPILPADNVWHQIITRLPVSSMSAKYVSSIGSALPLHPDFGSGNLGGGPIGIPYNVVPPAQPLVPVHFTIASESDPGPYPIPPKALIEGGPRSRGDRHVLVVDTGTCTDYEMWKAQPVHRGASWKAGSGAVFNLGSDALRKAGNTSADAAGLPILPGLVRYDEVVAGVIDHAIRVTVGSSDARYIWPARHQAGTSNPALPPMGLRLRLKASVDISRFSAFDQVILQALKTYGMIVADNGTSWFISGAPDPRWDNTALHALTTVTGSNFEAVDESCLMVGPDTGATNPARCP
jgi:hypothetical protein